MMELRERQVRENTVENLLYDINELVQTENSDSDSEFIPSGIQDEQRSDGAPTLHISVI